MLASRAASGKRIALRGAHDVRVHRALGLVVGTLAGCPQAGSPAGVPNGGDAAIDSGAAVCGLEAANASCWTSGEGCAPEDVVLAVFPHPTDADPYVTYGIAANFLSDLDGDGRSEVVIGALDADLESYETGRYNYSTPPQRFVFLSSTLCGPSIAASSVSARVVSSAGMVGQPVASVYNELTDISDLDGDGLAESAILDVSYSGGPRSIEVHAGATILEGGELGPDAAVAFVDGTSSTADMLEDISNAGDVDGDLVSDTLVGSLSETWLFSGASLPGKSASTSDAWLALPAGMPCGGQPFDYDGDGVGDICQTLLGSYTAGLWSGGGLAGGAVDAGTADVILGGNLYTLDRLPDVDGDGRDDLVREVWLDGGSGGVIVSVVPAAMLVGSGSVGESEGSFFVTSGHGMAGARALAPGQGLGVHTAVDGMTTFEVFDAAQIRAGGEVDVGDGTAFSLDVMGSVIASGGDVDGDGAGDLVSTLRDVVRLSAGP